MFDPILHPPRLLLLLLLSAVALGAVLVYQGAGEGTRAVAATQPAPAPTPGKAAPSVVHGAAAAAVPAAAVAPAPAPAAPAPAPAPTAAGELVAEAGGSAAATDEQRRGGIACAQPHLLARIDRVTVVRAQPGGRSVGSVPPASAYLGQPTTAWVQQVTADGRWGKVTLPWSKPVGRSGWIALDGLATSATTTMVVADLSRREATAYRGCRPLFSVRTAIGRPGSPSPTGRFWVSDRVAVPAAQQDSFGTFAFGLSTVQPNLPAGWTGGDQMAIHGTGAPGSIGEAASAGCLRVSEDALRRLKPLLDLGTPVIIQA